MPRLSRIGRLATGRSTIRLTGAALLAALLNATALTQPAQAQVTTNQGALDALGPTKPASPPHTRSHAATSESHHHTAAPASHAGTHTGATRSAAHAPAPTIPAGPPPPPAIRAPVINVPLHPPPPPPPVPVVQSAVGTVTTIDGGSRIGFGADSSDLNPTTMQALQDVAAHLKADPLARADIDAFSAGSADDPSTSRRMALARGLVARAVLINAGIPSTRIYVRAEGRPTTDQPGTTPNRVDVRLSSRADGASATDSATASSPASNTPPVPPALEPGR